MSDYFLYHGGKFTGPFTKADLIEMVAGGKASRTEPCTSASQPEVQTVDDVMGQPARGQVRFESAGRLPAPAGYQRNRGVYIILGLLFGGWGFHNFYAGYHAVGAVEFIYTIIAIALFAASVAFGGAMLLAMAVWVIVEICRVKEDANGNLMA